MLWSEGTTNFLLLTFFLWKSLSKCPLTAQIILSITKFEIDEKDRFSNILITTIDSMGKPEQTKRFDRRTNYYNGELIQDGYLKTPNSMMIWERINFNAEKNWNMIYGMIYAWKLNLNLFHFSMPYWLQTFKALN